jgi:hypothetical protein
VESDTTVQYQSYHIFLGFQFLVYKKVERIFLIISNYLKQKADACRRNVSRNRLEVLYHRLAGRRPAPGQSEREEGQEGRCCVEKEICVCLFLVCSHFPRDTAVIWQPVQPSKQANTPPDGAKHPVRPRSVPASLRVPGHRILPPYLGTHCILFTTHCCILYTIQSIL